MSINQQAFAAALAKGSGRAMILLSEAPQTKTYREELIRACVYNLAYDRQCEHERSEYLARLVEAVGDQAGIFAELAPRLSTPPDDEADIPHLFAVLARLAARGGEGEKSLLRKAFQGLTTDDQLDSMEAFVRLDGLPALLQCSEMLKDQLQDEGWRASGLIEAFKEREGLASGPALLAASAEHPRLGLLMAHRTSDEAAVPDAPYVFSDIRSALLGGKRPPGAWLQKLSDEEWLALASDLERQADDAGALRYLRLFAARRFPSDPEQLLRWLNSSDSRTAWATVRALGQIKDPRVRKLALERLREGDSTGLRLLKTNYEPGDLGTIAPLLSGAADDDQAHDLGLGILNLIGKNEVPLEEKRAALLLLYERTPCSMCRGDAVSMLVRAGSVPSFIAEECRFDADPDTAKLFSEPS